MSWDRAKHSDRAPKVALWGDSGVGKTRGILSACCKPEGKPRLYVIDYEDSTTEYEDEFNFARFRVDQVMKLKDERLKITPDELKALQEDPYTFNSTLNKGIVLGVDFVRVVLLNRLAKNPIDHIAIDPLTVHTEWEFDKWVDIYAMRETSSQGNKRDYYNLQARDYKNPNRVLFNFMNRLKALNCGVWIASHDKPKYDDMSDKMMKRIGDKPDAYKKLEFMMDTVIGIIGEESGTAKSAIKLKDKYIAIVQKDRTHLLEPRFLWRNSDEAIPKTFLTCFEKKIAWEGKETDLTDADKFDEAPAKEETPKQETPKKNTDKARIMVNGDLLEAIKYLKDALKIPADKWAAIVAKRNVNTARSFTANQARELIKKLSDMLSGKNDADSGAAYIEYRIRFEGADAEKGEKPKGDSFSALE